MSHRVETFDIPVTVIGGRSRRAAPNPYAQMPDSHTEEGLLKGAEGIRTSVVKAVIPPSREERLFTVLPSLEELATEEEVVDPSVEEIHAAAAAFEERLNKGAKTDEEPRPAVDFLQLDRDPTPEEIAGAVKAYEEKVLQRNEGLYGIHPTLIVTNQEATIQSRGNKRYVKATVGRPPSEATVEARALEAANKLKLPQRGAVEWTISPTAF